jgi:hypothetical protein
MFVGPSTKESTIMNDAFYIDPKFGMDYASFMFHVSRLPVDYSKCKRCGGTGFVPVYCCPGYECGCYGLPVNFEDKCSACGANGDIDIVIPPKPVGNQPSDPWEDQCSCGTHPYHPDMDVCNWCQEIEARLELEASELPARGLL